MYHEVCMAILPPHRLAETLRDWDEIAEQLAEPSRKRPRGPGGPPGVRPGSAPQSVQNSRNREKG